MAAGAALLLALLLVVLLFGKPPRPDAQLERRAQRLALVGRMQLGLASASEAEKSAVLSITDRESQAFAAQARATTADVERERRELADLLRHEGTQDEKDLLADFSAHFAEFQRVDDELLKMAVENTNLRAYALAFGPAAGAIDQMNAALSRVAAANASAPDEKQVLALALGAQIAALRIEALLPPHIAEPSDPRMDELEARMKEQDEQVRADLDGLRALPKLAGADDLAEAASRYAQFGELRGQILALSRANTNVRSLSISLNEKRKVMLVCQEALARLQEAIEKQPLEGARGRFGTR
jgi:hypothetical protein